MIAGGNLRRLLAAACAALVITGCGGSSTVTPATYVKSVCLALGNWTNTIQSARVALESAGAATASRQVAKVDYQRFLGSLVTATRRATTALRRAGVPAVNHGRQVADRLTRAFTQASQGLSRASLTAGAIRTDSTASFQSGAGVVSAQIKSALERIAQVQPGQNRQLRSAAASQPACQLLSG